MADRDTRNPPVTEQPTADLLTLAHFFADKLLERWHEEDAEHVESVADFMGLSDAEYAMWAESRYHDLAMALRESEA